MEGYAEVREIVGHEAARVLQKQRAGRRIYVPKTCKANHWITQAIGVDAAQKLIDTFGGLSIDIPLGEHSFNARLKAHAIKLLHQNMPLTQVCQQTGIARSTAERWAAEN